MKEKLIQSDISEEKIYVTGVPLSDRFFDEFNKENIYKSYQLDFNKKVILFFGGGEFGLGKKRTVQVLKSLATHLDTYQIIAISGKNKKMNNEFLKLSKALKNKDLHVLKYSKEIPELMSISSLVVTKPGGLTSSESLVSELPMIIINPIPGQEEENAEFLENSGVGIWIKKDDNIDETITNLLNDSEKIEQMRKNCLLLAKKHSTQNICDTILKNC